MAQTVSQVLKVNPNGNGGALTSIGVALQKASTGTLIQLAPGIYDAQSGEAFPLVIPEGVILSGSESNPAEVVISGGGNWRPSRGASLSLGLILVGNAQLRGITVTNDRGSGVWIETGRSLLRACQIVSCRGKGLWIGGDAMPKVLTSQFKANVTGLQWSQQAKGEMRQCRVEACTTGLQVEDNAAPLVIASQITGNRVGAELSGQALPVLRQVAIARNQTVGLYIRQQARPDLGLPQDEGHNVFRHNQELDVRYEGRQALLSVGNDVLPHRLSGPIRLAASLVPNLQALSGLSQNQAVVDKPIASPEPQPSVTPVSKGLLTDMRGHWAAPFCEALAQRKLIKGFDDGAFRPNIPVTRAQFAALVNSSFPKVPATQAAIEFSDVEKSFWAASAISAVQQRGFLSGYPDGAFRPHAPMTRIQAIVAISNGLQLPETTNAFLGVYQDRAQVPSYAVDALSTATQHRLVVNYPDPLKVRPMENITRAEVAALVYQGLVAQGEAQVIASEFIVRSDTTLTSFPDITGHWAESFIQALTQQNWIKGFEDGRFRPNAPMTRAQYATLLTNALRPVPVSPASVFRDVPPDHWAAKSIDTISRSGFLTGFPDQTFAPDHAMLRVQLWVSLINGLDLMSEAPTEQKTLTQFQDASEIPAYAADAVAQAARLGFLINPPGSPTLNPNRVASRADISAGVYQALVQQKRMPPIVSSYIVKP